MMKKILLISFCLSLMACSQATRNPDQTDEKNKQVREYSEYQGKQAAYVSLQDLGCSESGCGQAVLNDPQNLLARSVVRFTDVYPNSEIFVGLLPGQSQTAYQLQLDPELLVELLDGQEVEADPAGYYSFFDFAIDGEYCAVTEEGENGESRNGQPGGICGANAIAHSLVYRLTVVEEDWDGVLDGDNWDPDFLRAVQRAAEDDDGNREVTRSEVSTAHQAEWNKKWRVRTSLDWTSMPSNGNCNDLKTWCERMERFVERYGDDCIVNMRRESPSRGHLVTVNNVTWNQATCRCSFEAVNTGKQDGDANDFRNVPKDPGKHTWELGPSGQIQATAGSSLNFWRNRYNKAWVACYDEEPRSGDGLRNEPGDAFPD